MIVVILGGYGNFGARIARALIESSNIDLYIAGRHLSKATALAEELGKKAYPIEVDIDSPSLTDELVSIKAELVIHTAGPFQAQGYQVPFAVAKAGAHYIDLADGRRYVCDFPSELNDVFKAINKVAISGASTVPGLSSAVIDQLSSGWKQINSIEICIAPAQTAPRGIATLEGVLSYCGMPIQVWEDGKWNTRFGWSDPKKVNFKRLSSRMGALCDIPDLELFPARYSGIRTVTFSAALEVKVTQYALSFISKMKQIGLFPEPKRLARLFNWGAGFLDFMGTSLGGMIVIIKGQDGTRVESQRSWHIAADDDLGPEIPCMAAILIARKIMSGEIKETGAYPAMGWLSLDDFKPEFEKWGMVTDTINNDE